MVSKTRLQKENRIRYYSGNVVITIKWKEYPFSGHVSVPIPGKPFGCLWRFQGLTVEPEGREKTHKRAARKILNIVLKYTSDKRPENASRFAPPAAVADKVYENYVVMENGMAYIERDHNYRFGRV